MIDFLVNWAANVPAFAAPFALAALGLIVTEKSGVLSLGAEGYLLMGALAAAGSFVAIGDNASVAFAVGALAAAAFSLVFALMAVTLRVNRVVAGLVAVFLAQGLTGLIGTRRGWTNQPIAGLDRISLGPLSDIPALGSILFRQDMLVYLTLPIFFTVSYLLSRTMVGLRLRAVGDAPEAADAAGANVTVYRYGAIVTGSAIVGLAGAYLSGGVAKMWVEGMSGGRGWIAVALVIFARWQPWRAFAGAILFGGIEALIPRIAAVGLQVPQYFMLMAPYIATLAVMVYANLNKNPERNFDEPRGLGQPYLREER